MLEVHYKPMTGTILHVIADEEGMAQLRASFEREPPTVLSSGWNGIPIFRPGLCDCPIVDVWGRRVVERCIQCQLNIPGHAETEG